MGSTEASRRAGNSQAHQLLGMGDGQIANQGLVKQREDGSVGADTQRQSKNRDGCEDGALADLT